MKTAEELRNLLGQIDRKSYPAYKNLKGSYRFSGYVLGIDHVQGDPFAAPSRVHIEVEEKTAGLPERRVFYTHLIQQEIRKREHYEKPSVRRKKKSEAARKRKYN